MDATDWRDDATDKLIADALDDAKANETMDEIMAMDNATPEQGSDAAWEAYESASSDFCAASDALDAAIDHQVDAIAANTSDPTNVAAEILRNLASDQVYAARDRYRAADAKLDRARKLAIGL